MLLIYGMAIANALLVSFLLLTQRRGGNSVANRWLAGFVALIGALMADDLHDQMVGATDSYMALPGVANVFTLAIGPCLYLSILSFTQPNFIVKPRQALHFLPWFVHFPLFLLGFWLVGTSPVVQLTSSVIWLLRLVEAFTYLALGQTIIYIFLSLHRLERHQRTIQLFASSTNQIDLRWMQRFIFGVAGLVLIWAWVLFFTDTQYAPTYAVPLFALFYYLGYFAFNQPAVYAPSEAVAIATLLTETESPNATVPLLSSSELEDWKTTLLDWMAKQKPYTEPAFTLPQLAQQVNLSTHKLSYVINKGFGENFFQWVNRYRVEESKRLLSDPSKQHLNILQLGYEAGFNSKTVFNTSFKRQTGLSPSAFQRQQQQSRHSAKK